IEPLSLATPGGARRSELDSHAGVFHTSIERRPGVNRPPAVDVARGPQHRIPVGLFDVREILAIDEEEQAAEATTRQHAENAIRRALSPIGICFETLTAGVVPLDGQVPNLAEVPGAVDAGRVPRRQRHFDAPLLD